MHLFKSYSNIKDFLHRYTIISIGNFKMRIHKLKSSDKTTLTHNHPFNYISIVIWGAYKETYVKNDISYTKYHKAPAIIKRTHDVQHRIEKVKSNTTTLFLTYGKYKWFAKQMVPNNKYDGLHIRVVNDTRVFAKKLNNIWYIGNKDRAIAENEIRHSIHQI